MSGYMVCSRNGLVTITKVALGIPFEDAREQALELLHAKYNKALKRSEEVWANLDAILAVKEEDISCG